MYRSMSKENKIKSSFLSLVTQFDASEAKKSASLPNSSTKGEGVPRWKLTHGGRDQMLEVPGEDSDTKKFCRET